MQHNQARIAEPLHIQRLEAALDMGPFMEYAKQVLSQALSSDDDDDAGDRQQTPAVATGVAGKKRSSLLGTKEERQSAKMHLYNFQDLTADREWLYDVILSDTDSESEISDEDEYVKDMLKSYMREQRHRENFYKKTTNTQYAYYGAGLLAAHDMFPEHQQSIVGIRKRKRRIRREKPLKLPKPMKQQLKMAKPPKLRKPRKQKLHDLPEPGEVDPADLKNYAFGDTVAANDDDDDDDGADDVDDEFSGDGGDTGVDVGAGGSQSANAAAASGRGRRKKHFARTPEALAARRRRVWQLMAKKELGRCQRSRANNHKEMLLNCKRMASMCSKVVRQRAMYSQKVMKEVQWRAKRLSREMLSYWKRYERVERDNRRRLEKEAEEQRKMDVEIIEAKRQQRKLNFLITQTELYAHFMSKKLGQGTEEEQLRILNQLDEEANPRLAAYDDYDPEKMKLLAQQHVESAYDTERVKRVQFNVSAAQVKQEMDDLIIKTEAAEQDEEKVEKKDPNADLPQPKMFQGTLKAYQIKGMTWLANLYDQGISGILADEMGLGKTVQSIAFLCHIAEQYGVWGPFLIVSPASTLHNWQQEMKRFVPDFNVVPYWGSPNERRILRTFWEQKDLHTRDASFHVVITSYQLIVSDYKFFNRIKWQYMILDEAQAIKSSSSNRWKMLLGFNCRNRLLLSGTPIQNSMAELWALLHFIMPTLFDSHEEFNEWFSKDIESHAENKTGIDEKQISRLHMILKPFMLRRIKKDVENELSDKIEIMVYCPLTIRQKLLYMALKQKIRIEDLLNLTRGSVGGSSSDGHHHQIDKNFTSNLMNLVMQFRKVCNHPELFERRDARSPFGMRCQEYVLPRLIFDEGLLHRTMDSKRHLLYNKFSIFKAAHMQRCLFDETKYIKQLKSNETYPRYIDMSCTNDCGLSFMRFCNLSLKDMEDVTINGLITLLLHYRRSLKLQALLAYRYQWWRNHYRPTCYQLLEPTFENPLLKGGLFENSPMQDLLFTGMTSNESTVYAFGDYKLHYQQETIEHRVIRSKHYKPNVAAKSEQLIEEIKSESTADLLIKSEMNLEELDVDGDDSMSSSLQSTSVAKMPAKSSHEQSHHDKYANLAPKFAHINRMPQKFECEALQMPRFLYGLGPRVQAVKRRLYCESRAAEWAFIRHTHCENSDGLELMTSGLEFCRPHFGWSSIIIPDKQTLVSDAGKLAVLDGLLTRLKAQGHRVLIYSQMTKMIDLLEEFMWFRKHRYMRLDGSSKISARRDMVADFQTRQDIFVFLLSTRAGGLGINLTAADTVIFYDSDWNPTVDQQAMDRAHRLGQTKQVTVYRLICKGTIEERILQRAREKSEIQRMVISGGNFKPDSLKPKEVVSLLLDDEEIEMKYRQRAEPMSSGTSTTQAKETSATATGGERKRRKLQKQTSTTAASGTSGGTTTSHPLAINEDSSTAAFAAKRSKFDAAQTQLDDDSLDVTTAYTSAASSPSTTTTGAANNSETFVPGATSVYANDDSDNEAPLIVDCESSEQSSLALFDDFNSIAPIRRRHHPRGTKRGRPRGSTRRAGGHGSLGRSFDASPAANSGSSMPTTPICADDDLPTTSHQAAAAAMAALSEIFSPTVVPSAVKRGPGRPRLKTDGPVHRGSRGSRGTPRARKPIGPLAVPLGRSPAATPLNRSPVASPAPSPAHSSSASQGILMTSTPTAVTPPKRQLSLGNDSGNVN